VNDLLARLEQRLLDEDQQWYRHVIYGWNIYSLYDGQPFPGLADAMRVRDAERAQRSRANHRRDRSPARRAQGNW
jgi:transferrin receptor-like protein